MGMGVSCASHLVGLSRGLSSRRFGVFRRLLFARRALRLCRGGSFVRVEGAAGLGLPVVDRMRGNARRVGDSRLRGVSAPFRGLARRVGRRCGRRGHGGLHDRVGRRADADRCGRFGTDGAELVLHVRRHCSCRWLCLACGFSRVRSRLRLPGASSPRGPDRIAPAFAGI